MSLKSLSLEEAETPVAVESESERKNILIVPVYIANEWVFSTKSASSSKEEAAEGNTTPALHQKSLFLSSSVKR